MLVSVSMLNMALPPEDTPCPLKGLRHLWLLVSRGARVNLSPLTHLARHERFWTQGMACLPRP